MAKPIVKWAGGKRQMLPELRDHIPDTFGRYFEPFVGGGALFFWLQDRGLVRKAVLSDLNSDLVNLYRVVQEAPQALCEKLQDYADAFKRAKGAGNDRTFFESVRATKPSSALHQAAWLMFLNKTCFNGLYRVNKSGRFNTPYGRYKAPVICDAGAIWDAHHALADVHLRGGDFRFAVSGARKSDLVYFDPPYLPASDTADFTTYTPGGFGYEHHVHLRDLARTLKDRGVHVIISNSGVDPIRDLYVKDFDIHEVRGRRAINSKGAKRGPVPELIIT